jgi:hypothetical protein
MQSCHLPGHQGWHSCSWMQYEHCVTCCHERGSQVAAEKNARLRQEILGAYGRSCSCCGESNEVFLVMDHIGGGGNAHRREIGHGNFYRWLKRNGYPPGFQTLCHNCNFAKHLLGVCPHQVEGLADAAATSA